ncbi:hypothetical protein CRG98_025440 [Punica granatum]|uniref:Protein kinase domain-containing protein n=1 Tax=Punica granatum TaxID=22663 RepID=A0A2I0JDA3_PUNGR|nr:hypothetical protein CRG98_025440 [Punica granatum]
MTGLAPVYPDDEAGNFENLTLASGRAKQLWVDYDGTEKRINVTLAPFKAVRPSTPLLSLSLDLSAIVKGDHVCQVLILDRIKRKYAEVLEDWELHYGPHRLKYKDLYIAIWGFLDQELLGTGCFGFGSVYKGILPASKFEIAVKRISHNSRREIREFVADIINISQLQHRNLVTLLGLRIIKGVAPGLLYLHEWWGQVVIHRDSKASNVLLDAELNGRLGDFRLARLCDHGTYHPLTTHVVGTLGYLAYQDRQGNEGVRCLRIRGIPP